MLPLCPGGDGMGAEPTQGRARAAVAFPPAQVLSPAFGSDVPEGKSRSGFPASLWAVSWFRGCTVPSPALGGR